MNKLAQFKATKEESLLISKIAARAVMLAKTAGVNYDFMSAVMDIEATHSNGCPLRLSALLSADDANFGHDVFGIRNYIDRVSGELTDCFVPRFAQPQEVAA